MFLDAVGEYLVRVFFFFTHACLPSAEASDEQREKKTF